MATATITSLLATAATAATSSVAPKSTGGNRAPSQGGVIEGANPSVYNPKDPITMFIIQVSRFMVETMGSDQWAEKWCH